MTLDDFEKWTERAAIMEYDGGLTRQAATFAAFELYWPDDYKEGIKKFGKDNFYKLLEKFSPEKPPTKNILLIRRSRNDCYLLGH